MWRSGYNSFHCRLNIRTILAGIRFTRDCWQMLCMLVSVAAFLPQPDTTVSVDFMCEATLCSLGTWSRATPFWWFLSQLLRGIRMLHASPSNKVRKICQICLHIGSSIVILGCIPCEDQNVTETIPCMLASTLPLSHCIVLCSVWRSNLTELHPSNCLNPMLRFSNRIQPCRLGLSPPQPVLLG